MKKVLILVNRNKKDYDDFIKLGFKAGLDVTVTTFKSVKVSFRVNEITVEVQGIDISVFSAVYFRSLFFDQDLVNAIVQVCKQNNIVLIDSFFNNKSPVLENNKVLTYISLALAGVPIINSCLVSEDNISEVIEKLGFPLVLKTSDGFQGNGVHLAQSHQDITNIFSKIGNNKHLIAQEFIDNTHDLRLFVIDGQCIGAMKRSRTNTDDFRNNASLGSTTAIHTPSEEEKRIAVQSAQILDLSIAGIDLIFDTKEQQIKVLEVNRAPQFNGLMKTTGINIPQLVIEFIQKKLSNTDK